MVERGPLLDVAETLTPADHQTHRRYAFDVPADCQVLEFHVRYAPKLLAEDESFVLAETALERQTATLAERVGESLAAQWADSVARNRVGVRIPNLLTISVDDSEGVYRGAAHRHAEAQRLLLGRDGASPGFVAGSLPPGSWRLTLSAHTVASAQCGVSIQIGAETATSV